MDYLRKIYFEDYKSKYLNINSESWIPLFESFKGEETNVRDDIFSFCALIDNKKEAIAECLSNENWDFSVDSFGKSSFFKIYSKDEERVTFESGDSYDIYEYLVAYRTFNSKYEIQLEINPNLIWFRNLVKVESNYVDPDTDEVLIKIEGTNKILVERNYLKDFLAAYNKICIIAFDHRRHFNSNQIETSTTTFFDESKYNFSLQIFKSDKLFKEENYFSILFGKTLLLPFSKIQHPEYKEMTEERQYETFIISVDEESGDVIEHSCNEDDLSNFFGKNPEAPHFLTPVFFNRKVLDAYIADPTHFSVEDGYLRHLDKWGIPFTINEEDKVMVWLGDLGRIPHSEQKRWKVYNEPPRGTIEPKFYKRQLMAQFTEAITAEKRLLELLNELNRKVLEMQNAPLFNDLSEADQPLLSAFSIPSNNSTTAYQQFLLQLCKLTTERINTKLFTDKLSKELLTNPQTGNKFGSIIQMQIFVENVLGIENASLGLIFKKLHDMRSNLAAHSGSIESYNKTWGREKNYKPNYIFDAKVILNELSDSLTELIDFLELGGHIDG